MPRRHRSRSTHGTVSWEGKKRHGQMRVQKPYKRPRFKEYSKEQLRAGCNYCQEQERLCGGTSCRMEFDRVVALQRWRGGEGRLHMASGQLCSDALDIPLMLPIWGTLLGQHDTSTFWTTTPTSALTSLAPLGWTSLQVNVLILRQSAWLSVLLASLPTLKQPLAQLSCC